MSLRQLAEFPFIDSPPGFGNRMLVDRAFSAAGVDREVTVEVADVGTAVHYVRAGLGVAFLSRFLVPDTTGVDVVEVADHDLTWQLTVATSATRRAGAPAQALLDLIEERYPTPRRDPSGA